MQDAGNTTTLAHYWRDRDREVDFVARAGQTLTAIEVKSGRARDVQPGLAAFGEVYRPKRKLLVGGDGIRWRSSFPGPSSTGYESEQTLQDFGESVAEIAIAGRP